MLNTCSYNKKVKRFSFLNLPIYLWVMALLNEIELNEMESAK